MITTHILASFRAVLFAVPKVYKKSHMVRRVPLSFIVMLQKALQVASKFFSPKREKLLTVFVHFVALLIFTKIFSLCDLSAAILSTLY